MVTQAQELCARPHVVVATPGRLVDLLKASGGEWGLERVQTLVSRSLSPSLDQLLCELTIPLVRLQVLDEADRMLTTTFAADLAYVFSRIPAERQTCLFTATNSDAIRALAEKPPRPGKLPIHILKVETE